MKRKIRYFFNRIKNLIRWFPIIWKDQDWDDYYIFEILKFKIKNQAKYIGYHDRHVRAKRDAEIMMLCVRLMDRVQNEYYGTEYFEYFDYDIDFIPSEKYPGRYEMKKGPLSENFNEYFKKYPRIYKQIKSEDREEIAYKMAHINEERAHKLLFKILERNIRRWWD